MRLLLYGAALAAGALLTAVTGQVAWTAWSTYRVAPAAPLVAAAASAPDGRWVRVQDLALRCDTRVESRGSTFFLAAAPSDPAPVVVHVLGQEPCPAAAPDGGFLAGKFTRAWLKEKFDVVFPGAEAEGPEVRLFTSTLAPEYQRSALYRVLPMFGFGLLMLFLGGRGVYRTTRATRTARAPGAPGET